MMRPFGEDRLATSIARRISCAREVGYDEDNIRCILGVVAWCLLPKRSPDQLSLRACHAAPSRLTCLARGLDSSRLLPLAFVGNSPPSPACRPPLSLRCRLGQMPH